MPLSDKYRLLLYLYICSFVCMSIAWVGIQYCKMKFDKGILLGALAWILTGLIIEQFSKKTDEQHVRTLKSLECD